MKESDAPIVVPTSRFTIEGKSRAGNETWFRFRELDLAFDIGRCPDLIVPVPDIFLSHSHLDHAAGIALYAAQRGLMGMEPGRIHVPSESLDDFRELMAVHGRLERCRYDLDLRGVQAGDRITVRKNLEVRAHGSSHGVPSLAFEVVELRHRLKEEFRNLPGADIARLRKEGGEPTLPSEVSLLFYTGDTDRNLFAEGHPLFRSEVLIAECSFTGEDDRGRAKKYRHLHFEDFCDVSDQFENSLILLVHFSLRDSPEQIHRRISARCPPALRQRLRLGLPEPFSTLR